MAVSIDGVGNVVGRYAAADPATKTLIVGSHYDTVVDAGKYDGRLGILTGLVVDRSPQPDRAPAAVPVELIGFAEEEGVRFSASYIGSTAVAGSFDRGLLARRDAGRQCRSPTLIPRPASIPRTSRAAGAPPARISPAISRCTSSRGRCCCRKGLPVGVVTAIAGNCRYWRHGERLRRACRHGADGACAATRSPPPPRSCSASSALLRRAPTLVGTVGRLAVPDGAINVIAGPLRAVARHSRRR